MDDPIGPREDAPPDMAATSAGELPVASPGELAAASAVEPAGPTATQNPYASPLAVSPPVARRAAPKVYYPLVPRYWAATIDSLGSIIFCLVVGKQLEELGPAAQAIGMVATFFLYYFLPEALLSATPGKGLMGIMVVRRDGGRCTWSQALVRNLVRLVEANPLFAIPAALAILFTPHKQRIGDLLAGTIVVLR